jgi:hypothetical protein
VVEARVATHAGGIRGNAAAGASGPLLRQVAPDALDRAAARRCRVPPRLGYPPVLCHVRRCHQRAGQFLPLMS